MNTKTIYIPCIDNVFNAEFIADVFHKNDIAQVSKIYLEPNKSIHNTYHAYIEINSWYDTETAYNFIERLRNPNREARIIYSEDDWWPVYIKKNTSKLASTKRVLTIFQDKMTYLSDNSISITPVVTQQFDKLVSIDFKKTQILRDIIHNFKKPYFDDDHYTFDSYLREIDNERQKCLTQQYIL